MNDKNVKQNINKIVILRTDIRSNKFWVLLRFLWNYWWNSRPIYYDNDKCPWTRVSHGGGSWDAPYGCHGYGALSKDAPYKINTATLVTCSLWTDKKISCTIGKCSFDLLLDSFDFDLCSPLLIKTTLVHHYILH